MKRFLPIILFVSIGCSMTPAPPADFKGEWTPLTILGHSADAYGGESAILGFNDMTVEQMISVYQGRGWVKGETLMRFKPPEWIYESLRIGEEAERVVYHDGETAGEIIGGQRTGRKVQADLERRRRQLLLHGFFMEDGARHTTIDMRVDLEGVKCVVLARKADGERWRIWIDLEQYLIRKVELFMKAGNAAVGLTGDIVIDWYYSDFRWVGKRLVPHAFLTFINKKPFQKGKVERAVVDTGLTRKDFSPREAPAP